MRIGSGHSARLPALLLVLAAMVGTVACSGPGAPEVAVQPENIALHPPQSVLLAGRYETRRISLEIADEPAEHTLGLSHRDHLAPDAGMLFIFPAEKPRKFWMHETRISLDIIFMDSTGRILGIARRAKPEDDTPLGPEKPSRYVLEITGGLSDRLGIKEGDRIEL